MAIHSGLSHSNDIACRVLLWIANRKHISLFYLRMKSLTIPYKALRECLLNALAHRLYDSLSGFVSIAVYDDRVEVENLGTLPAGFTLDDTKKPHISHAQNPLIAQIMYYRKYLETWGLST